MTRRQVSGADRRARPGPSPVSARHEARPHQHAVVGDRRRHERHLERRDERLALAERGRGQLDVVGEAARARCRRPPVTRLIAVGRSNGIGAPNPSFAASSTSRSPPVASPASAYQMLQLTSVAPTRSSAVSPVCGWWPSRIRNPSTSRPFFSAAGCSANVVSGSIGAGVEAGDRGHDLEHRARHVAAQRRARQQRVGRRRPGARSKVAVAVSGSAMADGVVRRASRRGRGSRPSPDRASRPRPCPCPAPSTAARCRRRSSDSRRPSGWSGAPRRTCRVRSPNGSAPAEPEQLGVVGALEARRAVLARGVAHDVADRSRRGTRGSPRRSRRASLRASQRPSRSTIGPRSARRAIAMTAGLSGARRQALGLDDLPPAGADREDRERAGDGDAGPEHVGPDARGGRAAACASRSCAGTRRSCAASRAGSAGRVAASRGAAAARRRGRTGRAAGR